MREELASTIAILIVIALIVRYELPRAQNPVVVIGLISAGLAVAASVVASIRIVRGLPRRWGLVCPRCDRSVAYRRARSVCATGCCQACGATIVDRSPAKRSRAALPSERVQLDTTGRGVLLLAAIAHCGMAAVLPPFSALRHFAGAVVDAPSVEIRACSRFACRYYVGLVLRHTSTSGQVRVAERRLAAVDVDRLMRLRPGDVLDVWIDFDKEVAQLDLGGRRLLSYDSWIRSETRRWMVLAIPFLIWAIAGSMLLVFRSVHRPWNSPSRA